jgi:hypothetical protein
MSSGTGDTEAGFLDASVSGDDVFFLTSARLAVTDVDDLLDVYDARVGGTAAVIDPVTECFGDLCRAAPARVPDASPGSSFFTGPGNVKPGRKCPKGKRKVQRGGKQRCVPRKGKKRKGGNSQRRSGQRKGAGR